MLRPAPGFALLDQHPLRGEGRGNKRLRSLRYPVLRVDFIRRREPTHSPSGQPGLPRPIGVRNIGGRLKVGATRGVSNSATGHDVPAFRSPVLERVRAGIPQDQHALGRDLDGAFVRPETEGVAGGVREPTHHRWIPPRTSMHRQRRGHPLTSTTPLPAHPIGRCPDVAMLARLDPNISLHPPPALAAEPGGS